MGVGKFGAGIRRHMYAGFRILAAVVILMVTATGAAFASHLESGSIGLSNDAAGATGVTTTVTFRTGGGNGTTPAGTADIVITFPAGFGLSTATLTSISKNSGAVGYGSVEVSGQQFRILNFTDPIDQLQDFVVVIGGVNNPTAAPAWVDSTLAPMTGGVAYSDALSATIPTFGAMSFGISVFHDNPGGAIHTNGSRPATVTGNSGPTTLSISSGTLPTGLSISYSTVGGTQVASITGTPTVPGETYSFTLRAENDDGFIEQVFSGTVQEPVGWTDTTLAPFMRGVAYSDGVSASGSPAPTYSVSAGSLPSGLSLNPATGAITGTPTTAGPYSFTIQADNGVTSDTTSFSGTVAEMPQIGISASFAQGHFFAAGQTLSITFTVNNTGPVDIAALSVESPQAGVASCGAASLAMGESTTCTSTYVVTPADIANGSITITASVIGDGEVRGTTSVTIGAGVAEVEKAHEDAIPVFVQQRQSLLAANVYFPGLGQRTRGAGGVSGSGNNSTGTLSFTGSLIQVSSGALAAAESLAYSPRLEETPFNLWVEGMGSWHENTTAGSSGTFALTSLGGDYLVNEDLLIGAALHVDWMYDRSATQMISGNGYLAGPYISAEVLDGVILDAGLFFGRSRNDSEITILGNAFTGQFETDRVLFDAILRGEWKEDVLTVRPNASFHLSHESAGGYLVTGPGGANVAIAGFESTAFRGSVGAIVEYDIDLGGGLTLTPDASFSVGVGNGGNPGLFNQVHGSVSTGFTLASDTGWAFNSDVRVNVDSSGFRAVAVRGKLGVSF